MSGGSPLWPARPECDTGSPDAPAYAFYEAVLGAVGEIGYREIGIGIVLERCGAEATDFHRHFADKEDCFAAAYEAAADCACALILNTGRAAESWADGFIAALARLFELVTRQPAVARAMLIEAHRVGEQRIWAKRQQILERLSRAIDSARRETGSRHSSSPLTGRYIVGAIEAAVYSALPSEAEPRDLWRRLPELVHLAALLYFDEEVAWAAHDAARPVAERALGESAR